MKAKFICPHCNVRVRANVFNKNNLVRCWLCKKDIEVVVDLNVVKIEPYALKIVKPSKFLSQFD